MGSCIDSGQVIWNNITIVLFSYEVRIYIFSLKSIRSKVMNHRNTTDTLRQILLSINNNYHSLTIDKNLLTELHQLGENFQKEVSNAQNQNRLLRIGIIGQIKRGKSSFLNSLLFNGEDILPKAATPMTAALTKINYAEQPQATVEFYTRQEWQKVTSTADKVTETEAAFQTQLAEFHQNQQTPIGRRISRRPPIQPKSSDEQKACCELVSMVKKSGINIDDYLGKEHIIDQAVDNSDLVGKLTQFVGAEGAYTPIVKSTELKLNIPALQGIEVVDTPGMNDPIISRGRRTQEFIGQCDVVFFLSYCGQFLDMHDMGLLAQNIPNKGIKDIVLIGSVFDGALLDEYHKYDSIQQALPAITNKLATVAKQNVEAVCQQGQQNDSEYYIFNALTNALPPIFISSRCFDLSRKGEQLSEEEAHSLKMLNSMYTGFEFSPPVLKAVANFAPVNNKLEQVRGSKETILAERLDGIMLGAQRAVRSILLQIQADISQRKKILAEGDLETMASRQQETIQRIQKGEKRITAVFDKQNAAVQVKMTTALNDLKQIALDARRVETQSGSKEEAYEVSRTVSTSSWYNPFSWGSTETVYSTEYRTVHYSYANVQEAVDKLETFVHQTDIQLNAAVMDAIHINQLKQDIKAIIRDLFDFSDDNFDPEAVMIPLENALARLTMPCITLNMDKYIDNIRQQFTSSEVQDDDITKLRQEQARIIGVLLEAITKEVDSSVAGILRKLDDEKTAFIPELTKDLTGQVEQLSRDLKDSEQTMTEYNAILTHSCYAPFINRSSWNDDLSAER